MLQQFTVMIRTTRLGFARHRGGKKEKKKNEIQLNKVLALALYLEKSNIFYTPRLKKKKKRIFLKGKEEKYKKKDKIAR